MANIKSTYVKGARKEASDFLNARIKQKCPNPPKTPKIENKNKSFMAIGSKNGIRIIVEINVPTNEV